jgi:hypothetical protein
LLPLLRLRLAGQWLGGPRAHRPDPAGGAISENYFGGGIIEGLDAVAQWCEQQCPQQDFELQRGWLAFSAALDHARQHGRALGEVSDVFSSFAGTAVPEAMVREI